MTVTCPDGHVSTSDDYCDVCGAPIVASGGAAANPTPAQPVASASTPASGPSAPAAEVSCPNCSVPNPPEALFCEACGYDFTTGTMPRTAEPGDSGTGGGEGGSGVGGGEGGSEDGAADTATTAASEDPAGAGGQPAAGSFDWVAEVWIDPDWYAAQQSPDPLPSAGPPEIVPLRAKSILIGRTSRSRNIHPELPCENDTGVSRRQSQLTTDGSRWWVEDLDSSNGTFVGSASGTLPEQPIPVGPKHELDSDDRIYLGAWTRIVIREATEDEKIDG